ncbi:MAG: excinuclease ABC subunit UvrA [Pseudomonadota bacterium]
MKNITIKGARTHNLKNVSLNIPRDKLIVITGLSGSGKSSLAFDTLYAEGQRRYVESLSAYARQFLSLMDKPDVELIDGLSPAISIEQKSTSHNPRSTVGTITEIYDYLRLLFARVGTPHCPEHKIALEAKPISAITSELLKLPNETKIMILAPLVVNRKGEFKDILDRLKLQGFVRVRVDGKIYELDEEIKLNKRQKHNLDVVIDRIKIKSSINTRLTESLETASQMSEGVCNIHFIDGDQEDRVYSTNFACPHCGFSLQELEPRLFSFNSPSGACQTCDGLGTNQFFDAKKVIVDDNLSVAEGAIRGWDKRNVYYFHMLSSLADHYQFDISIPFKKLREKVKKAILYGSGKELIPFNYVNDRGDIISRTHVFEGVIPNMERRYRETESENVRDELTKYLTFTECSDCHGTRLNESARNVLINEMSLPQITSTSIGSSLKYFQQLSLKGQKAEIAEKILKEIQERLGFLVDVGLNYLTLNRSAETLSGGEAQRIRLASQIGAGLVGVMYVLDEPSIGLHQRDNERLLKTLFKLRDLGNTVIIVEHDEDAIRSADHIIDIGPGAGVHGGNIVAEGSYHQIIRKKDSLTAQYLSNKLKIEIPKERKVAENWLTIQGARGNNLKSIDAKIPIGLLTCVTGVSGSGKSTLINDTLYPAAAITMNKNSSLQAADHDEINGLEFFDKIIDIDQSPIGRTPRSNPATYTGIFTPVRELFSNTQEARSRGYKPGRFSFNVKGGRCESCQGDGLIKVEMHFLPDVYVMCDTCNGKRYNAQTLEIHYKGKNIHEVLEMTVEDALEFFDAIPVIRKKLQTLMDVGLSYITLGQAATTLSGGEAQRVKLARELSKRDTGKTLYILDEPTTGLHFHDINQLLSVIHRLRDHGNTVVIIEHNLDVIKTADWIIDLGPEGGDGGGEIISTGTPETIAKNRKSHTGRFLKSILTTSTKKKKVVAKRKSL